MEQQVGVNIDSSSKDLQSQEEERIVDRISLARRELNNEEGSVDGFLQRDDNVDAAGFNDSEGTCDWVDDGDEEEEDQICLGLIGRLWSERILNLTVFTSTIKNVWVTDNRFLTRRLTLETQANQTHL
ncbi:unnamed protein product [Amaranthus hypochondriacus]